MKQWLAQLKTLTAVNFYGYFREPAIIFWALIFPAGIAGVLGVAFQGKPPEIPIALVADTASSSQAESMGISHSSPKALDEIQIRQWKNALEEASRRSAGDSGRIKIEIMEEEEARLAIKRGRIYLMAKVNLPVASLRINRSRAISSHPDRSQKTLSERAAKPSSKSQPAVVEAHYDANNPEARLSILALQQALTRLEIDPVLLESLEDSRERGRQSSGGSENFQDGAKPAPEPPVLVSQEMDAIGGRYIDFLIPGLLAVGIMNSCMWGVGYGLIDLRVKKLMRRMAASPMHKSAFLTSHFVARMAFTISEAFILFGFAHFLFDVSIQGSLVALLLLFLCGNVAWSGVGILCSSRGRSMHTANGIVNAVTLPLTMLSGIFFSYHNFPEWSQAIIQWLPLTVLADTARAIFIEGAGLAQALIPSLILLATGLITASIGLKIYRWH